MSTAVTKVNSSEFELSLLQLYDQQVLADPYPLYHRLQAQDPVHWDPFLHAWVVTRYRDVVRVLQDCSARCAPSPERLASMAANAMLPISDVLHRQMLFLDPPDHTKLRTLCTVAFTPQKVAALRNHIQDIAITLLEKPLQNGYMDAISDFADPLPSIVTAEILGLPPSDHRQLKAWSSKFAEILGNFQHNPDYLSEMLQNLDEMCNYFRDVIREDHKRPKDGLIHALLLAEVDGHHLSEVDVISNCILLVVGGQETTPNLIGNGLLALLRNPDQLKLLMEQGELISLAIEEMLRYEAPSQHTTRVAPSQMTINGRNIEATQSIIAVMGAANRDPARFENPDRLDIRRAENKHLSFGAGNHFCFGAPLARIEGNIAFATLLRLAPDIALASDSLTWRHNLGLRGLESLPVTLG